MGARHEMQTLSRGQTAETDAPGEEMVEINFGELTKLATH